MTDRICAIALRERAFLWWWIAMIPCGALTIVLVASILWLFYAGVGIWGIDWPVMWGFAIINYVWWIAIASGGTFISALFYLLRVDWRINDLICGRSCRDLPDLASWPAMVVLLVVPVSKYDELLAAMAQSAVVGLLRYPDLCHRFGAVLASGFDTRPGEPA